MEIKANDFNIEYNSKLNKYEIYYYNDLLDIVIYKRYEVNYTGNISQVIINDIKHLIYLGFRLNPYITRE